MVRMLMQWAVWMLMLDPSVTHPITKVHEAQTVPCGVAADLGEVEAAALQARLASGAGCDHQRKLLVLRPGGSGDAGGQVQHLCRHPDQRVPRCLRAGVLQSKVSDQVSCQVTLVSLASSECQGSGHVIAACKKVTAVLYITDSAAIPMIAKPCR